ncbi:2-keto-4-pentenoate hydratase [Methylobacterium nonmethylotrophicum]|uniref:Fumarylacetoacetase-like C-terminal domain-containing protein n=1 Tax=Methylobacterium nonmethylotrophicum TaxID=1141884 RepID=A0A4Z0NN37_9HYPH|nr:fumarylacetoacetate hydrolase family protein [Methylobacterium nonmethylotrophicum]TGD98037.1 hypothetical protein EU555_17975 [Methylobacterium nonmethylotrophicum]
MTEARVMALGRALAASRRAGTAVEPGLLDPLPEGLRDDPAAAEAVQAEAVLACGEAVRGTVLCATARRTARLLACPGPVHAPLLASSLREDGAVVRTSRFVLGVGAQYLAVLGRPFPGENEDPGDPAALAGAILSWRIGLQVLARRLPDCVPLGPWSATADFGLDAAELRGAAIPARAEADLADAPVTLRLDGHAVARGSGAEILEAHPLAAVAWLARALDRVGRGLEAGDVVATGSCTGLIRIRPGQRVEAEFGAFGQVGLEVA